MNRVLAMLMLGAVACDKVAIVDIDAGYVLADAVWFEDEQTLFIFYRVAAEQGLEPVSRMELRYRTDTEVVPWTPLSDFTPIHTHLPVDCGPNTRCGSWSLKLPQVPRDVGLRLRYHPEGSLGLDAPLKLDIVSSGPAHTNRSLIVYGVFDEPNLHVQWRARHQFPNLRNEEVEALGLRREFALSDTRTGDVAQPQDDNPYWYAVPACVGRPLGWASRSTTDRAVFEERELPPSASAESTVCGTSTVTDAKGKFQAVAVARKNPEVRPAFPKLHSPIKEATQVRFMLRLCNRAISTEHFSMQEQRLLLAGLPTICLDDWRSPGFPGALSNQLRKAVDSARTLGRDVVLSLAFHHDDTTGQLATVLSDVLATLVVPERDLSTPRLVGAFVFDSYARTVRREDLRPLVLWCPALLGLDLDLIPATSERSCPLLPDIPDLQLGPFKFNTLPILPTREQYLTFISKYSAANAGKMNSLTFLSPEHTPLSKSIALGTFGVATFFNNEIITPAPSDALSYCTPADPRLQAVVVLPPGAPFPIPLEQLPEFHRQAPQASYSLGLAWDSPFLLRLNYEVVLAGSVNAFSLSVPFGIKNVSEKYWAGQIWQKEDFDLTEVLKQCTRFCSFPTFSASDEPPGVYLVNAPFRPNYETQCYRPAFPKRGDGGFPRDP